MKKQFLAMAVAAAAWWASVASWTAIVVASEPGRSMRWAVPRSITAPESSKKTPEW